MKKIYLAIAITLLIQSPGALGSDDVPADQNAINALKAKGHERADQAQLILEELAGRASDARKDPNGSFVADMKRGDAVIPDEAMKNAECIVVIPGLKHLGFSGLGGTYGAGIKKCRLAGPDSEFGEPTFVKLEGGNYGPQLCAESTDQVLLFMNKSSKDILQKDSLKLGGDASVAIGPWGRDVTAQTNLHLKDGILSYSHSKGLCAAATLTGAKLGPDKVMNAAMNNELIKSGNIFKKFAHLFSHKKKPVPAEAIASEQMRIIPTADQPNVALASSQSPDDPANLVAAQSGNLRSDSVSQPSPEECIDECND